MTAPALVRATFLGHAVGGGVSARMRDALLAVEADLRAEHAGLPEPRPDFVAWCGVRQGLGGYREGAGFHAKGVAIDIDYELNPYIATRTGTALGGEAAGAKLGVRAAALAACDRACAAAGVACDLAARRKGEPTGAVWDRFDAVHRALVGYFAPWFHAEAVLIRRRPVPHADVAAPAAFAALAGELLVAVDRVPVQVLRDYEAVRVPMVRGAPSVLPSVTRNPARGFLTIPRHVAVALCDVGTMRWGACDFGAAESGDIMHFDAPRLA